MSSMNILFVCMGNICRSPTAHGVFRQYIDESGLSHQVTVNSAGTHAYHVGEAPDARSQTHALKRGYDLSDLAARQLDDRDFDHYDLLLVQTKLPDDLILPNDVRIQFTHKFK